MLFSRLLLTACFFIVSCGFVSGQFKILHYTETSGFDHFTRDVSYSMFQQLGLQYNFITENDSTGDSFNSLVNLQQYAAVVFANTTGDALLDSAQRSNFEQYMSNGGNVIGIHSSADTYRHSTANGTNTGSWDFFSELLGASVQQNPNHVNGTPFYNMHALQLHPLLNDIPDPWYKAEEYYYWQSGYYDSLNNIVLLRVDTTVGPNGMVNGYDLPRAIAWYKIMPSGNRIFYTATGHAAFNYTSDSAFIHLIRNAVLWASGNLSALQTPNEGPTSVFCYPNPFSKKFTIQFNNVSAGETCNLQLFNARQQEVMQVRNLKTESYEMNLSGWPGGIYFLILEFKKTRLVKKLVRMEMND